MFRRFIRQALDPSFELKKASDVVRFSFVAQRSISYLDLSLCELTSGEKLVHTEEGLLRHLKGVQRKLMQQLHLDDSLKSLNVTRTVPGQARPVFYIGKVRVIKERVYYRKFGLHIVDFVERSEDKLAQVRRYIKPLRIMKICRTYLQAKRIYDCFVRVLFESQAESQLVVDVMRIDTVNNFMRYIVFKTHFPEHLDFVLGHTQKVRLNPFGAKRNRNIIHECMFYRRYNNIPVLLKYFARPQFEMALYNALLVWVINKLMSIDFYETGNNKMGSYYIGKERTLLQLQLFFCYYRSRDDPNDFMDPTEALRLIWRTVPSPFLCRDEIVNIFAEGSPDYHRLRDLGDYYRDWICDEGHYYTFRPRSLLHLCRCRIRVALSDNFKLVDGLDSLPLPSHLKDYLRLER